MIRALRAAAVPLALVPVLGACESRTEPAPRPSPAPSKKVSAAIPAPALDALRHATLELLSLYPYDEESDEEAWADGGLRDLPRVGGFAVLGGTTVEGDARAIALSAVFDGIDASDGVTADCFEPRHALRATTADHRYELVLCFACLSMDVLEDGREVGHVTTTEDPRGALNAILRLADVPLPEE